MKKVLALTLVLVLALSMSTIAFAATTADKIDYADWDYDKNFGTPVKADGITAINDVNGDGKTTIYIPIEKNTNLNAAAGSTTATGAVTGDISKTVLSRSDMDVKLRWTKGSQILDEAKLDKDNSLIKITFKSNVATIKDIEYKFEVLVTFGGRTLAGGSGGSYGTAPVFEGTWTATTEEIGDADWFDFDGTSSFKTDSFVRKFEYGFDGLAIGYGRALKGVKYWADANEDVSDADQEVMIAHSAVVGVIHMNQINVKPVLDYVKLENSDASMYVYDGDMNYLGRGNDELPYADTYYLAASQLEVDTDDEPVEEDDDDDYEPDWGDNSGTGGDDLYPENPHDNPGTGK